MKGYNAFVGSALELRMDYERQLTSLMAMFGVFSEAELVSGCVGKFNKFHRRKQVDVRTQVCTFEVLG